MCFEICSKYGLWWKFNVFCCQGTCIASYFSRILDIPKSMHTHLCGFRLPMFVAMIPTCVVCPLCKNNGSTFPSMTIARINGNPQGCFYIL